MDAHINPELLLWARQTAGLTIEEAARRSTISLARLLKAESGEAPLTTIQLEKYAATCRRPVAAFYLPKPPEIPQAVPDFRRLPGGGVKAISTELRLEIRRAQQRRVDVIELADELEEELPKFTLTFTQQSSAKDASVLLREYLGISLQEQLTWGKPEKALKAWKRAAETAGVLVFEVSRIAVSEMRGVALSLDPLPIAILNGADEASARTFSLLHELTHLALNVSAIDGGVAEPVGLSEQDARTEKFCNEVAGEFLVPSEALLQYLGEQADGGLNMTFLASAAKRFSVSREVIARRLLVNGRIGNGQFQLWREQLKEEYEAFLKEKKAKSKASKSGPRFEVIQARNLSQTFMRLAFNAYEQDHLSLNGVSGLLGLKVKSVFALRDLVRQGADV